MGIVLSPIKGIGFIGVRMGLLMLLSSACILVGRVTIQPASAVSPATSSTTANVHLTSPATPTALNAWLELNETQPTTSAWPAPSRAAPPAKMASAMNALKGSTSTGQLV